MSIKKKVKKLLQSGKSVAATASHLSIHYKKVNKIKQEIIQDKKSWNKKQSILDAHCSFIRKCITEKLSRSEIHAHLKEIDVFVSYPTVTRFVAKLNKCQSKKVTPGFEAKVFFFSIGTFNMANQKKKAWIFIMKLTYSKYACYLLVYKCNFSTFLTCHKKAFKFFNGMPRSIKINFTKAFNINEPMMKQQYLSFLNSYQIVLAPKNKRNYFIDCKTEERFFKEHFLCSIVHKNYKRLSKELKCWYISHINLGIHPVTGKVIEKKFKKTEHSYLLPIAPHKRQKRIIRTNEKS